MPIININDCNYHYEIHGSGEEFLVFSHGLLWNGSIFEKQIQHFQSKYSILIYDQCGHGQSEVLENGFKSRCLYIDFIQLLEYLKIKQVHFVGLSMGTDIGIRVTLERPDLVKSLILMSASISPEDNYKRYKLLNNVVSFSGIKSVLQPILVNMFSIRFLNDPKRKEEVEKWSEEILKNKKEIHVAISSALNRKNIDGDMLQKIACPTLILAGTEDKATPPENSEFVHLNIKDSTLNYIEGVGHMICLEEPETCNFKIDEFLDQFNS